MAARLRIARRLAALVAVLLLSLLMHGGARALRLHSDWVRRFLSLAARSCGARVRIVGVPLDEHVLFAANHLSWLDILVLGGATGAAFVSKAEVAQWPIIGRLARIGGTIFVARESRAAARGQADALATALAGGRPAALFPEGTTGDGRNLLPFRASLFAAVGRAGVFVQPVWIDYGAEAADVAWPADDPAGKDALRLLARPATRQVTLHFLNPIAAVTCSDRKALAAAARAAIVDAQAACAYRRAA